MIHILPIKGDDTAFIQIVESTLNRLVSAAAPDRVVVINIDHWFDFKWKDFSGKTLGALGTWNASKPRVPPFIPSRVVSERNFERIDNSHAETGEETDYHGHQSSSSNIKPGKINENNLLMVWYSGDTVNLFRGSLMVYDFTAASPRTFYVSFAKNDVWNVNKSFGISRAEATELGGLNASSDKNRVSPKQVRSPRLAPGVDSSLFIKTVEKIVEDDFE